MPIYEYKCAGCEHQFEKIEKVSDPTQTECPECHSAQANRIVSSSSFQLKGTGWYVTDFKDKKPSKSSDGSTKKTNND